MSEYRHIQGELKLLKRDNDFIFPVELWLLNDKVTRNDWQFVNLAEHREKWAGVPILTAYVNGGRTVGDGHNQQTKTDRHGDEYQSFVAADAERIVGAMSDDPNDIRLVERDGALWTVGRGFLWAFYSHELCLQIADDAQQGRSMSVSIEALVTESHMEGNVEVETAYEPLGVTVLGRGVAPAVEDAHIAMLSEITSELKELKLRAASYMGSDSADNKPQNNDKKDVKKAMNYLSKKALPEIQELFGEGYAVLSAAQNEETTTVTVLRKSDYAFLCYELGTEKVIDTDRLTVCAARLVLERSGEEVGCADACEVLEAEVGELCDNAETAKVEAKAASERADKAEAALKDMEARETARRIKESGVAAERQLSLVNENRAENEKFSEDIIADIKACAEKGDYVNCFDANGDWCGDKNAMSAVRDLCMQKQMEMDKQRAEQLKASASRKYAFEPGDFKNVGGGIEALYNDVVKN